MTKHSDTPDLRAIAEQAMIQRGFLTRFPVQAQKEADAETEPSFASEPARDLSAWVWSSIDNDDSRDLDQVEYAAAESGGIRLYVGIADVDWFVPRSSAIDRAAEQNTTSIYTGVATFPMLPERLSTDLSSLNEGVQRLAMVTEVLVMADGSVTESAIYPAIVHNQAQLTYDAVAAWLENLADESSEAGRRTLAKIRGSQALQDQLRLQDQAAGWLRERRHEAGALSFRSADLRPVISADGTVTALETRRQNRASLLIEDLMIAVNQATAMFLDAKAMPSVRRVVRTPARWDRIVALAGPLGGDLPEVPDAKSLEAFLIHQRQTDPSHFADLSLAIIKLLGRGEYVLKSPGDAAPGHFGLAVTDYSHSTAPNRRYPDLLTQRILKAAVADKPCPYSERDLAALARHCTEKENDANKVERFVKKCAAAAMLRSRLGEEFEGIISGVTAQGTWVRLSRLPVEGKLQGRVQHLDVGARVHVRLVATNPERGFIDFELK